MKNYKSQQNGNRQSVEDKALQRFTDLMIKSLENFKQDWKKPWFSEASLSIPRNLNGRQYNGMNSVMLMLHCQNKGYELPIFCTFDRASRLNDEKDKETPRVSVLKGEKSFPVFITTFTVINAETKEKVSYEDYKQMSDGERDSFHVFPKLQVYNVFNIAQTNIKEARPELYAKIEEQCKGKRNEQCMQGEVMPSVDAMISNDGWFCPIREKYGDEAYYSISRDEIVVPNREQFKDAEAFMSTLFHEMTHSTGSEERLNRIKPTKFGSKEYASEELTAELTAAFVAANYGMTKFLKEDSACYIKSWLESLHESPSYLKSILLDVKKASNLLIRRIDAINERIEIGLAPVAEEWREGRKKEQPVMA